MYLEEEIHKEAVFVQPIQSGLFLQKKLQADVLRLDKIHAIVSGNKWFKLKYYLEQARQQHCEHIATFGGAYSNHILATAYACNKEKFTCTAFIRGELPKQLSATLQDALALNMQLEFVSREAYSDKQAIVQANPEMFFIPEGGYGKTGAKGAGDILQLVPILSSYNYIVCAAGTGTMLAGIANNALPQQQCIGISVMKNNLSLENETHALVESQHAGRVQVLHDHHFGGYAKCNQQLIDFINDIWAAHSLPLDFVYTAKAFYALQDLAIKNHFPHHSKILFIHSGGLQGNRSFKKGTLLF